MMKNMKFILIAGLVVIVGLIILLTRSPKVAVAPTPSPAASAMPNASPATGYEAWELFKNGYAFPLPPKWKNTSDTNGTATFAPGEQVSTLERLAVTILSDKKAPQGQKFTTQAEFDQWSSVNDETSGKVQKVKNLMIDGEKAIMLADASGGDESWMRIVWTRHTNVNLYIIGGGTGKYTDEDDKALTYIAEHFTFTAPPSSDEKK